MPAVLTDATQADVAVVGAGLPGLWTALFLKELAPEAEVVVVDQGSRGIRRERPQRRDALGDH